MLSLNILKKKKKFINSLAKKYGAKNLRVFGSIIHGHFHKKSDLDLLVKMNPGKSLLDLVAFSNDLEDYLQVSVDVVDEEGLSPYLKEEILSSAVAL